ncbi:PTS sugar transporter subunit IIA [Deltaproteobacteria bacterium]|nr:PTS sugar transporter subunit IIA [Deltaproteobacteria bacterium]
MAEENEARQIGIIIVSTADYGSAMLRTAESILGPLSDCSSISVDEEDRVSEIVRRLDDAAKRLNKGNGVIILTDMFGGTPTNLALALLAGHQVEVVTGVNLPMLLKVFTSRDKNLDELARAVAKAGVNGIVVAGSLLREKAHDKPAEP